MQVMRIVRQQDNYAFEVSFFGDDVRNPFAEWRNGKRGASSKWVALLLALLYIQMSPWLSPMKFAAQLSEPGAHLLHGALVTIGFLLPGLILTWLVNRAERQAAPAGTKS